MKLHLAALAQSATGADAQSPPAKKLHEVPEWRSRATGDDMMRVYPRSALRQGIEGLVLVQCRVTKEGEMAGCVAEQEAPTGLGFGDAALKLMPRFRMKPETQGGAPVEGGVVRLPIQFRLLR